MKGDDERVIDENGFDYGHDLLSFVVCSFVCCLFVCLFVCAPVGE